MNSSNDYNRFLDSILRQNGVSETAAAQVAEAISPELVNIERKNNNARLIYSASILILFAVSYGVTFYLIYDINHTETALIREKLLQASERSINSTTILTMIGATATQLGLSFYAVTHSLFPKSEKSESLQKNTP